MLVWRCGGHGRFDGHLNTGLTLRTVRIANGVAEVRAGATLLFDSDPPSEERETELKASAMRDAVAKAGSSSEPPPAAAAAAATSPAIARPISNGGKAAAPRGPLRRPPGRVLCTRWQITCGRRVPSSRPFEMGSRSLCSTLSSHP